MSNEGQIPVDDRVNTEYIRQKLNKAYEEISKLDHDDVVVLCGFLVVVHNHWNWENLLTELKPNNKQKGAG